MSPLFSWIYVGGLLALGIWVTIVLIVRAAEWEDEDK